MLSACLFLDTGLILVIYTKLSFVPNRLRPFTLCLKSAYRPNRAGRTQMRMSAPETLSPFQDPMLTRITFTRQPMDQFVKPLLNPLSQRFIGNWIHP